MKKSALPFALFVSLFVGTVDAPRLSQAAEVDQTLQNAGIDLLELKRTLETHGVPQVWRRHPI